MKTVVIIISIAMIMAINSCNPKMNANEVLQDATMRTEIMTGIISNEDYMREFMEKMQNNEMSMQMMGNMMQSHGMYKMNDSMMMNNMMGNKEMMNKMMNNGEMMSNMMKMMNENGMMSNECMQSSLKMMDAKGMKMGEMGTMESSKMN